MNKMGGSSESVGESVGESKRVLGRPRRLNSLSPSLSLFGNKPHQCQMWPVISGQVNVSQSSTTGPRTEIPLSIANPIYQTSALIVGDHKLLVGSQTLGYW